MTHSGNATRFREVMRHFGLSAIGRRVEGVEAANVLFEQNLGKLSGVRFDSVIIDEPRGMRRCGCHCLRCKRKLAPASLVEGVCEGCDDGTCGDCGGDGRFDHENVCSPACDHCGGCYDSEPCQACDGTGEQSWEERRR